MMTVQLSSLITKRLLNNKLCLIVKLQLTAFDIGGLPSMRKVQKMQIISHQEIAPHIYELVLKGDLVKDRWQSGQFVHVKVSELNEPLLRRPLSICQIDQTLNQLTLIYRVEGSGTQLLATKKVNEEVDLLGPLGTGFDLSELQVEETVVLVGGGIGVPPMYELAQRLFERGNKVIAVLGFRSKADVFYEEAFKAYADVYIATMDGSYGFNGNVIEVMKSESLTFDWVFGCGPKVMLKAIDQQYGQIKKGYLSFEERMACGIGACYACVCELTNGKMARVCKEGPVFRLGEVMI